MKKLLLLPAIIISQTLTAQNVGIGTATPLTKLHIYNGASGNTTPFSPLVVEGNNHTYINLLSPDINETGLLFGNSSDASSGGIIYNNTGNLNGFQFRTNGNLTRMVINNNGNVGIGTNTPFSPLTFNNNVGEKLSFYGTAGNNYGLGIQSGLLQIHTDVAASDIAFGYGSSNSLTERMRILNNIGYDGMILNGRLILKNGSADLVGGGGGVWLYQANNSALLGFIGTQNNQNIGFYGGPANGGWGFVYDAINSRIGIGTSNPNAPLSFPAALGKKITLYPGATGDVGMAVQGNLLQIYSDNPGADIAFGYDQAGTMTERMRIKANGNVGIGTNVPTASLEVNGYTKLGSDAPSIKVKKLTGTTPSTEGGFISIPHGLDASKILSISVMVTNGVSWFEQNVGISGANFVWFEVSGNITINNVAGGSANILSKPFKILITYEE